MSPKSLGPRLRGGDAGEVFANDATVRLRELMFVDAHRPRGHGARGAAGRLRDTAETRHRVRCDTERRRPHSRARRPRPSITQTTGRRCRPPGISTRCRTRCRGSSRCIASRTVRTRCSAATTCPRRRCGRTASAASRRWYGRKFHGQKTSIGEIYDMFAMTAAHPTLPLPSYARVTNVATGQQRGRARQRSRPVPARPHHRPVVRRGARGSSIAQRGSGEVDRRVDPAGRRRAVGREAVAARRGPAVATAPLDRNRRSSPSRPRPQPRPAASSCSSARSQNFANAQTFLAHVQNQTRRRAGRTARCAQAQRAVSRLRRPVRRPRRGASRGRAHRIRIRPRDCDRRRIERASQPRLRVDIVIIAFAVECAASWIATGQPTSVACRRHARPLRTVAPLPTRCIVSAADSSSSSRSRSFRSRRRARNSRSRSSAAPARRSRSSIVPFEGESVVPARHLRHRRRRPRAARACSGSSTPTASRRVRCAPRTFSADVWRARGADAVVVGSMRPLPDGRVEVRFALIDVGQADARSPR